MMPLSMATEGSHCRVDKIMAGKGLARRLAEMGFIENAPLEIYRSEAGSVIVSVSGQKYAISRGIAMKIMVHPS